MLKLTSLIFFIFLINVALFAQSVYPSNSGVIAYTKTINTYVIKRKMDIGDRAYEQYKNSSAQFVIRQSTLTFKNNKTLFTPLIVEDNTENILQYIPFTNQINIIHTDFLNNNKTTQKQVLGRIFLINDTISKIKWKLTEEFREIANYRCRRANAIMLDSIYVVAFYTDEIHVSGGPESFNGLPGMILQVTLPHENVSWKAIKVTKEIIPDNYIVPPKKGELVDPGKMILIIKSIMKTLPLKITSLLIKDFSI